MWSTGIISRVYREGEVLTVTVHLTANHMGWFEFRLCPNNDPTQYVKQSCLNKHVLRLLDYPGTRYHLKHSQTGLFRIRLQLPPGLTCTQCVVQWHYTTATSPGVAPESVPRVLRHRRLRSQRPHLLPVRQPHQRVRPLQVPAAQDTEEHDGNPYDDQFNLDNSGFVDPFDTTDDEEGLVQGEPDHLTNFEDNFNRDFNGRNEVTPPSQDTDPTSKPSITFVDDIKSKIHDNNDQQLSSGVPLPKETFSLDGPTFRDPQYFNERQNALPSSSQKKYVSSDDFRRAIQFERDDRSSQLSAPTPFLSLINDDNNQPVVINSYDRVTPSPLGPPLVLPHPQSPSQRSIITPGRIHSVHSDQPPIMGCEKAALSSQRGQPVPLQGIAPVTMQVLQNLPALLQGDESSGSPPLALQVPLSSLNSHESIERLLLLQRALTLASSSSNKPSPFVLILV
ncbi:putative Lytic polysaccharide mono-oxygenase, cellulose-degrading-containing protein 2 [Homarus americanus]|uniref:Putative Lytic polysaccharide mono-oxygenase, cellulose-degrading-containing protein 2 n=1 Tax=Homarus americanus TaxID=6706 RepID=A0A8J5JSA4_HOMAM|nr:putative Lytic polysaccharide mono-oxygenase, cellulose-degrading-containing protein 2 [Homarus americanus]